MWVFVLLSPWQPEPLRSSGFRPGPAAGHSGPQSWAGVTLVFQVGDGLAEADLKRIRLVREGPSQTQTLISPPSVARWPFPLHHGHVLAARPNLATRVCDLTPTLLWTQGHLLGLCTRIRSFGKCWLTLC